MDDERKERLRYFGFATFVGVLLLLNLTGVWKTVFGIDTAAILTVLAGYRIFYNSISALFEKQFSADLAICIAVIAALSVGEYLAAAEAMFIMLLGEGLEGYAAGRTSAAIRRFVEQLPHKARLIRDGTEIEVDAASLMEGDIIEVRAGERIPADGRVEQGISSVDESAITGESLPRDKQPGDEVFSGTINGSGLLRVRVLRAGPETTLARVIALVEEAKERRAPVERLADRYAKYFLPALLIAGALTFYFTRDWLRTVAVLLVACPCALILATPTAMVAAIGGLARRGILVRGGAILQLASKIDTVVFDKTGTVTEGRFEIVKILPWNRHEDELLRLAAAAERASEHVLAKVIQEEAQTRRLALPEPSEARVAAGRGAECAVDGRILRAGNAAFLEEAGIRVPESLLEEADRTGATAVFVADGAEFAGAVLLRDRIRPGIREAVAELSSLDISHIVMLTGDRRRTAEAIAREIGIPHVEAELLPEQKLDRIRQFAAQGRRVAMVGDGINDAPSLAAAHVGIAVSGATDVTAEAADVVYMGRSLDKLPRLFEVSRRAVHTAWQNIVLFAGAVNLLAVLACATGRLGPLGAAFTHQLSSFFVMLNSLRLLRVEGAGTQSRWRRWWSKLGLQQIWERVRDRAGAIHPAETFAAVLSRWREWWKPALCAATALYFLSGVYVLNPDETGVVERFGKKLLPYSEPGLHYKWPWPIDRLTRVQAQRVRVIEIGFRSEPGGAAAEPPAYEWNIQHRTGRFQRKPEESLMLTGDQNMIEVNAAVHYRLAHPDDWIFRLLDGESTVRAVAESALHSVTTTASLDAILTEGRREIEERVKRSMQATLDRYGSGVEVLSVRMLDVHPSQEVVDAFREVSGAMEEKNRLINEAEGYRNEQVALARGNARARVETAQGYSMGKKNRARGDADRFTSWEAAYRTGQGVTETRLYLETMEQVLPGRRKMIVDASRNRRHLMLLEDGIEIGPAVAPAPAPAQPAPNIFPED